MKIKITAKQFVRTFTTQNHLNTHRFDDTGKKIHWSRSTNSRNIISFNMINNIRQSIQSFLNSKMNLMVNRTNIISRFLSRNQIRTALETNSKTMKLRPPSRFLRITFNTFFRKFLSNSSNNRRIQPAAQKNTVRNITHKLLLHSRFKPIAHLFNHTRINYFPFIISSPSIILYSIKIFPITLVPANRFCIF